MSVLPKRDDPNFQSILNTWILLVGFGTGFVSFGMLYQAQISNDKEVQSWIIRHEALHKERQLIVEADKVRTDERLRKLETEGLKFETLQYRMTVNEQAVVNIAKILDELKVSAADQASDLRVIREVLAPGAQTGKRR